MYLKNFTFFKQSNHIRFWTLTHFTFLNLNKKWPSVWTFCNNFTFFPPNLSNQYNLNLRLIFQKPIRFGIEKIKGKRNNEFKMQFKIFKNPIVSFCFNFGQCTYIGLHFGGPDTLNKKPIESNGIASSRSWSFFTNQNIWRPFQICH